MTEPAHALVSEEEFLALPETLEKVELVDGEVIVSPSPTLLHQTIIARLVIALSAWADASGQSVTVAHSPLDIRFSRNRILQPDVMVFLQRLPLDIPMPIDRVPELCAEILSTNRVYDRVAKRVLYAEAGVREYWLVDADRGVVERCDGDGLARAEQIAAMLESPLLPGFRLDVAQLLRRD